VLLADNRKIWTNSSPHLQKEIDIESVFYATRLSDSNWMFYTRDQFYKTTDTVNDSFTVALDCTSWILLKGEITKEFSQTVWWTILLGLLRLFSQQIDNDNRKKTGRDTYGTVLRRTLRVGEVFLKCHVWVPRFCLGGSVFKSTECDIGIFYANKMPKNALEMM
jgi:hypothetical protein